MNDKKDIKEGGLLAPVRPPLSWENQNFYDQKQIFLELERVFDICHSCRRCISLCNSFPTLFDLIDKTSQGEVSEVDQRDYVTVIDQCFMCDMCYVKCPYVSPHEWSIDFPQLMLRAKAWKYKSDNGPTLSEKLLSSTDTIGRLSGIPVITKAINKITQKNITRKILSCTLNIDQDAWIPEFSIRKLKKEMKNSVIPLIKDGKRTSGKVAIYGSCFINYHEPHIAEDLLMILSHNQIYYQVIQKVTCCAMPKLELGDLDGIIKSKVRNIPILSKFAKEGYTILTPIPSCTLMFKQMLPLMFPNDSDVNLVSRMIYDPFEYFVNRNKDNLLDVKFKVGLGIINYHIPCHLRKQNIGQKTAEILKMIPNTKINIIERCSGHSGTWGVKKKFHKISMEIGSPVFKDMANNNPDYISSDCQIAGHHIAQGIGAAIELLHPLSLLRKAYGL